MLKVLHLLTSLNRGGIEKWLLAMLEEIPRSECEMDFCCKGATVGDLAVAAENLGSKVMHCPLGPDHIRFARQLKRILVEGQYHIVHNHLEVYSGLPVWLAGRLEIPVITSFHNTRRTPQGRWAHLPLLLQLRSAYGAISMTYAVRHSDLVTGCSQGVIASLAPHTSKVPPHRVRVLYYGAKVPALPTAVGRASLRQSFGWTADTPLVLHVGRFHEQKNHLGLLSIFERVVHCIPAARLLLIGEGPLQATIEHAIAERGLCDSIRLLGLRDDIPALMSKCDVFLFPSLYEGLPMAAIEANAANLPVVGSRIPGLTEAIRAGETGLLHDVEDVRGMAESVIRLINDHPFAQRLGAAGRQWVQENFSTQASARRLHATYRALVRTRGGVPSGHDEEAAGCTS